MKLKAAINGAIYDILEGATFAEEYSETLDSGAIIIDKVQKFDLRPYDDVFIFDADEDEYRGWGNHVSQSYFVYLVENVHFKYINQESTIGVSAGLPPSMILAANTGILISKEETDPLVDMMALGGAWYARIRCDAYYEQPQSGTEYFKDNIGFNALYSVTKTAGFPNSTLTFDKVASASESGNPPQKMVFETGGLHHGYYEMSSDRPSAPKILFINPRFSSYIEVEPTQAPTYKGFHKHMLVDQYEATCINITSQTYKYKIDLFSETKKLEKVILPNIALTQPIPLAKRKSVWQYLNHYVEQYSPTVKIGVPNEAGDGGTWNNVTKYRMDPSLESAFDSVYAPEMQMNQPTLRDVLTQLMLTKDMIPYVEDDVIKGMDLSRTSGNFAYSADDTTAIVTSMSSSNYSNGLKRQFDNALAQTKTCKRVEYLGFRNSDQGLLTLKNIRLEFSYPIYKIDKMYLCYWKRMDVMDSNDQPTGDTRYFLCKQDITPLILQSQKRNILSQDWTQMSGQMNLDIDEMAQYRFYTIGYDIGSKVIEGWAETYSYPDEANGWWMDKTKSYIENILCLLDVKTPFGIYKEGWELVEAELPQGTHGLPVVVRINDQTTHPQSPFQGEGESLWIKGLLFQVEYQAFYNGATYADKDDDRDDVISPDNPSSSLTVLEKDGIFQEAKANRFGNEATQINCRYADPSGMQPLASVFDGDRIVFRREYAIYGNVTQVAYSATKGYVLKNYFTSVFAQLRPFPLAGYDQSVNRADVERAYVQLSKDKAAYDLPQWECDETIPLSPFIPTALPTSINDIRNPKAINYQTIEKGGSAYASDVNCFVNGHSLCIAFQMRDNLGMGNYIRNAMPFGNIGGNPEEWETGSEQDWWPIIDDMETGELDQEIRFIGYNIEEAKQMQNTDTAVDAMYSSDYFKLPKTDRSGSVMLSVSKNPWKDQKETLNQTIQFEYQADKGIAISEMLPMLNDALGAKMKWAKDETITNQSVGVMDIRVSAISWLEFANVTPTDRIMPEFIVWIKDTENLSDIANGQKIFITINGTTQKSVSWHTHETKAGFSGGQGTAGSPGPYVATEIVDLAWSDIIIQSVTESGLTLQITQLIRKWTRGFWPWIIKESTESSTINPTLARMAGGPAGWRCYTTGTPTPTYGGYWGYETILQDAPNGVYTFSQGWDASEYYDATIYTPSNVSETLEKTQFVVYSENAVKQERAYDDKPTIDSDASEDFETVFSIGKNQITINLQNAPEGTKSVQYWYLDQDSGAYRFVFGVDVTAEELAQGYAIVYASLARSKDRRVFDFNMNPIGECANTARDIELSDGRYYN